MTDLDIQIKGIWDIWKISSCFGCRVKIEKPLNLSFTPQKLLSLGQKLKVPDYP